MVPYVARWDLDKTYLRTEFETLRDLLRTAFEKAEQKRTVPGAASLLREIAATGSFIHILSGSPEQLRSRLEQKLRLDGARWNSLTLKPNLQNLLRLRFRATREQVGYKLPALLADRARLVRGRELGEAPLREILIGDDSESDALIYSMYADLLGGRIATSDLEDVMTRAGAYGDHVAEALRCARLVDQGDAVDRILIHLDRQSPPSAFAPYGRRLVPFYNYLQAAFVLHEDGKLPATAVVRVAVELVLDHRFDGRALGRSHLDLVRRGHLTGSGVDAIVEAVRTMNETAPLPALTELEPMCAAMRAATAEVRTSTTLATTPDYAQLLERRTQRGIG